MDGERFRNREDAGRQLADRLRDYRDARPVVLALVRGGAPVAYEVARELSAPLDVWVVRKLGVPWRPELGVGAIAEPDYVHIDRERARRVGVSENALDQVIEQKRGEVEQRVRKFRGGRARPELEGRTVIVVDDGIATGGTALAAVEAIRTQNPTKVVLAAPVAPPTTVEKLEPVVDELVVLQVPPSLMAIGSWYDNFTQISDEEVAQLLDRAAREQTEPKPTPRPPAGP